MWCRHPSHNKTSHSSTSSKDISGAATTSIRFFRTCSKKKKRKKQGALISRQLCPCAQQLERNVNRTVFQPPPPPKPKPSAALPLFSTKRPPPHNRPSANQFPPQSPLSPRTASHRLIEIGTFNLAPQPASFRWWMAVDECNWTLEKRGRKQRGWWRWRWQWRRRWGGEIN